MTTCNLSRTEQAATPEVAAKDFTKPRYQASQDKEGYHLSVSVPGVGKSGVSLSLLDDVLTVTAERSDVVPESWKPIATELPQSDYRLRLRLDNKIDADRIAAQLENGVLKVTLPLKEADKPRVIEVG